MEKLNPPEQQDTEAEHSLSHLQKEVVAHEAHMQQARDFMQHCEVAPPINIKSITEKILKKWLDAHPELQKPLLGKELMAFQKELYTKQPELWQFMTFDVGIHSFSCDHYDDLQPTEKIKLIAAHGAIYDMLPLSIGLKNKQGTYDLAKLKSRYLGKLEEVTQNLTSTFKWDQWKNLGNITNTLQKDYGLTTAEAQAFKQYLDAVEKEYQKTQPQEANMWYFFVFLAGMAVATLGFVLYDRITNPRGMVDISTKTSLWPISLVTRLRTAEQPFSSKGPATAYLYDNPDNLLKKAINAFQSRSVTMVVDGKVGIEYDLSGLQDGKQIMYDKKTKMIEIELPEPTYRVLDQKAQVLARNSEVLEISKFNNLEVTLIDSLSAAAVNKVIEKDELLNISLRRVSEFLIAAYSAWNDIVGVRITIKWKGTKQFDNTLKN